MRNLVSAAAYFGFFNFFFYMKERVGFAAEKSFE